MALISEPDLGEALLSKRSLAWSGWGWECTKTPAPLSPPTRPHTQARSHSRSLGCPGNPSGPRALPGGCWSGVGGVRWRAGVCRLVSFRRSCSSSTACPPRRGAAFWPDLQVRVKGRRRARLLGCPTATASLWLTQLPGGGRGGVRGMCFLLYNLCLLLFQFNLGAALIFCISSCHRSLGLSMWCLG